MDKQMLVKSLGLQVEKLKEQLLGRDLSWSELKVSYKSLCEEMRGVISMNIALSDNLRSLKQLRKGESAEHEKVYQNIKNQMNKLSRSNIKMNESIINKSRVIEDHKRKYIKWKVKYTELAKQYPEKIEAELKRQKRELSQSHQKVRDMKDMYTEQLSHLNQKEEQLSKAKNELLQLQNDFKVIKTELLHYQQGDDVREEIQTVSKNEVARLSAELATEKTKTELVERSTKEKEVRLLSVERRLREELKVAKQKLYETAMEAEKNLLFFEGQAKIHEKIKKEHLHDLLLVEKGRSSQVKDLRREIQQWKGKVVLLEGGSFPKSNTCNTLDMPLIERKSKSSNTVEYVDSTKPGDSRCEECTAKSTIKDEDASYEASLTETEIIHVQQIQSNLEVIATLVFCCINGQIPENKLLEVSSGGDICLDEGVFIEETKLLQQKRLLTVKDYADFKTSIKNLLLDVRRLRGYITKKYASELTEQCYVQ